MAKPSAGLHTPRPSALRSSSSFPSTRSSVGSTSSSSAAAASKLPVAAAAPRDFASNAKVVAKCLAYDDDDIALAAATLSPDAVPEGRLVAQEEDLASLLELPDPDVSGDTSVISAAPDDALIASADSCVTEVPARADSTHDSEAPLPEEINVVLAELHGASGLSPRSKRLLTALAEAAAFELAPSATARRLRCAAFWGKVRVAVLAGTLAAVVVVDVALGAYLYARRVNDRYYHVLPPT
ncbi:hypothetical protein SETIT_1G373700v2 [Setaria italica]|uniref:Uncharacterized protein n=1 Tax=Setaria italica TaxID=4555 RepID=K3Z0C3_SETIT|nr:uncharacterized protein LOC101774381 [Setaria italica]RCV09024.1 hypothetical protein SETIT_1G373700v2 [Setaria italica]